MRFKVVTTYDSEYEGYIVDVPALVGCMSQGKTIDPRTEIGTEKKGKPLLV